MLYIYNRLTFYNIITICVLLGKNAIKKFLEVTVTNIIKWCNNNHVIKFY